MKKLNIDREQFDGQITGLDETYTGTEIMLAESEGFLKKKIIVIIYAKKKKISPSFGLLFFKVFFFLCDSL